MRKLRIVNKCEENEFLLKERRKDFQREVGMRERENKD